MVTERPAAAGETPTAARRSDAAGSRVLTVMHVSSRGRYRPKTLAGSACSGSASSATRHASAPVTGSPTMSKQGLTNSVSRASVSSGMPCTSRCVGKTVSPGSLRLHR